MKKFTVKDFITYNGPCFSCGEKIIFNIGIRRLDPPKITIHINTWVNVIATDIDLVISYKHILKLKIYHKTNKFVTTDLELLKQYSKGHKLFLISRCDMCKCEIISDVIELDFDNYFIKPIVLESESLSIIDNQNHYSIFSNFVSNTTVVTVSKLNPGYFRAGPPPVAFNMPLLPLYKFKNKETIINKIKTYLIFS